MAYASIVFNGTDEVLTRTLSTSSPGTTKFTYSLWVKLDTTGSIDQFFQAINAPTNTKYIYAQNSSTGNLTLAQEYDAEDWAESTTSSVFTSTGVWHHVLYSFDSTNATVDNRIRIYFDGSLAADTDGAAGAPGNSEAHHLFTNGLQHQIGAFLDVSSYSDGKMAFIEVIDGASLDPTSFGTTIGSTWTRKPYTGSYGTYGFCLDGSNGFNDVSGNGQHFTGVNMDASNLDTSDLPPYITNPVMAAAEGSFGLTGVAVELTRTRALLPSAGSFSLTGQTSALTKTRALLAGAGAFTLTGKSAALSAAFTAMAGQFTLTGQDAAFSIFSPVKVMAADAGAFVLTGQTAALAAFLGTGKGAFVLTGQDAALSRTWAMLAGAGEFTLAGQATALRAVRLLYPDAGAFVLTGKYAALSAALGAGAGVFLLSGQDIALSSTRSLVPGAGAFVLTGKAALLRATRFIYPAAAAFALTGQTATLTPHRIIPAGAGAFVLTGRASVLSRVAILPADVGVFALTGQIAALLIYPPRDVVIPYQYEQLVFPLSRRVVDPKTGMIGNEWQAYMRRFSAAWNELQTLVSRPK